MRICIVTGGASGIGEALATALVRRGDAVVVADLDAARAERVAEGLTARGPGAAAAAELDVRDFPAVEALFRKVRDEHGRLDLVFNNAGISIAGEIQNLTLDHWNAAIDINLRGVVHGVQAAYPIMLGQRSGHIINTASLAGLVPLPRGIPYTATKHAIVGLSLALRTEAAAHGVHVSVVCPGYVDTPMLANPNPGLSPGQADSGARNRLKERRAPYPPAALADRVILGVNKNRGLIVEPASARMAWRLMRLTPAGVLRVTGRIMRLRPAAAHLR